MGQQTAWEKFSSILPVGDLIALKTRFRIMQSTKSAGRLYVAANWIVREVCLS